MTCKLCGAEKKLVKAHVIPAAFFDKTRNDSDSELILCSFDETAHSKRIPVGVYDKELLCADCEHRFQNWDNYGATLLLNRFGEFRPVVIEGRHVGWRLDEYDYHLLKMFVLGLVWRAGASSHAYFVETTLGPFEQLVRQAILEDDPGDSHFFGTFFARWHSETLGEHLQRIHVSPYPDRIDGINVLRIYLGAFVIYVKIDKRRFSGSYEFFQLREQIPLVIVARDLGVSDEFNKTNEAFLRRLNLI